MADNELFAEVRGKVVEGHLLDVAQLGLVGKKLRTCAHPHQNPSVDSDKFSCSAVWVMRTITWKQNQLPYFWEPFEHMKTWNDVPSNASIDFKIKTRIDTNTIKRNETRTTCNSSNDWIQEEYTLMKALICDLSRTISNSSDQLIFSAALFRSWIRTVAPKIQLTMRTSSLQGRGSGTFKSREHNLACVPYSFIN